MEEILTKFADEDENSLKDMGLTSQEISELLKNPEKLNEVIITTFIQSINLFNFY